MCKGARRCDDLQLRQVFPKELSAIEHPSSADVEEARSLLGSSSLPVIAKIEHPVGVKAADEIAASADAVIVGRGDLALSLDWVELPAGEADGLVSLES